MIMHTNGYLETYYNACVSGDEVVGLELLTELEKLMSEMNDDEYIYDTTEADKRIHFIEHCVRLTKSPFYNQPMKLLPFQKAYISAVYGFYMTDDNSQRFQRILLLIARKNGKSELSSALCLADMFIGGTGLDIVCSSNDDNQASILTDAIDTMRLLIDPESLDSWRNQKHIRCLTNNNKIFKLSDKTRNKEGRNIDTAIIDEVHEMSDNVIVKSIEQSQSLKINPKLIMITTEGFVNDGFLDNELRRARGILAGEITDIASKRYLPWLYTQDSEAEVWEGNRENCIWKKSNPTLGIVKKYSYLEQQIDLARQSKADRSFVMSKDFNIKQSNAEAWLMLEDYDYVEAFDPEEFRNALCLGAVDIAETTDLSCAKVLLMKPEYNKKYIFTKYFLPEGKLERADDRGAGAKYTEWINAGLVQVCPGNYTDVSIIADWFFKLYNDYGFRPYVVGYDVRFATEFLKRMDMYGFTTEMVYQSPEVMSNPMKMVECDLKSRLIIGNTEIDRWCFANCAQKLDAKGNSLAVKIDGQVSRKIDGAVTTIILYEIYRRYKTEFENNLGG